MAMAEPNPQPQPTTQTDASKASAEPDFVATIERRRRELGINPDADEPATLKLRTPDFRMTPEQERALELAQRKREEREAEAQQRERESRPRHWITFCIECAAYADVSFEKFALSVDSAVRRRQEAAVDTVREYVGTISARRSDGEGLMLYGPVGTGKDHLAMIALRAAFVGCGLTIQRINGPEWYGRLRDLMDVESAMERDEIDRLAKCDFLLVSDPLPPKGELTPHQSSMLYRVFERRQANGRPTIVTINAEGMDDASKRLGAPVVDRMRYKAWVIECDWSSYRKPSRVVTA